MYQLEQIGNLILVSLEGQVKDEEIEYINKQLKKLSAMEEDGEEVVVSLNIANLDGSKKLIQSESALNKIVDFCVENNIRLYSYICE